MPDLRDLARLWRGVIETAHLMVGLPDYRRYVAHRLARHPAEGMMTRVEFVRECTRRRYERNGVGRCC